MSVVLVATLYSFCALSLKLELTTVAGATKLETNKYIASFSFSAVSRHGIG